MIKSPFNLKAAFVFLSALLASSSAFALAKFEPPDGTTYYGYCASGYWSDAGMDATLDRIYNKVSPKKFLLWSFFVHAKEKGRWNGWRWMESGPDGTPVHGSGKYLEAVRERGYVPVIAWTWMDWREHWKSPTIDGLLRGQYDWYLDEWIRGLKEFGTPVFIRLSHEMDGGWFPYSEGYPGGNVTAEKYVRYWRYVVDRFRAAGVTNVAWVWCVSGARQGVRDWVDYYPGDAYVDWIGADMYSNRIGSDILKELRAAMGTDKPIMVPEGGTEDLLSQYNWQFQGNAAWVKDFFGAIYNDMGNQVKAVCWFHWNEHSYVDRDPKQVPVYRDFIERSRFINKLHTGGTNYSSPDTIQPEIGIVDSLHLSGVSDSKYVAANYSGFSGVTGSKWTVEKGDPTGLEIRAELDKARIIARKTGTYTVKVHAWNKIPQHAYESFEVTVGGASLSGDSGSTDSSTGTAEVLVPSSLDLKANGITVTVNPTLQGFDSQYGTKWSVLEGDPYGLVVKFDAQKGYLTPKKPGAYIVKVEAWDGKSFASSNISVRVAENNTNTSTNATIGYPSEITLTAGGQAKTVELDIAGFSNDIGGKWSIESGDSHGLGIADNLTSATVKGLKTGNYTIKVQIWDSHNYQSGYIRVKVVEGTSGGTSGPAIVAPDWIEMVGDGREYQLDATAVGFTPKGVSWTIESGPEAGIKVENDGLTAYIRAWVHTDYVIKVEAWKDSIYTSRHIRVTVKP